MATTAQEIFELSMSLMDELNTAGQADHTDTAEYKYRTPAILTALYGELLPYSDNHEPEGGHRASFAIVQDMSAEIDLDDYLAKTVMPCGLTAMLLLDENPAVSSFYQQKYEELRDKAANLPRSIEAIEDIYGGLGTWPGSTWS